MQSSIKLCMITLASIVTFAYAAETMAEIVVIANPGTEVVVADIIDVFLGEKQFAGTIRLIPVDNGPLQESFLGKVLKLDTGLYGKKWVKKSFREGLNPPAVKSGDAEVIEYVKRTPGAVGYVGAPPPSGVTILGKY